MSESRTNLREALRVLQAKVEQRVELETHDARIADALADVREHFTEFANILDSRVAAGEAAAAPVDRSQPRSRLLILAAEYLMAKPEEDAGVWCDAYNALEEEVSLQFGSEDHEVWKAAIAEPSHLEDRRRCEICQSLGHHTLEHADARGYEYCVVKAKDAPANIYGLLEEFTRHSHFYYDVERNGWACACGELFQKYSVSLEERRKVQSLQVEMDFMIRHHKVHFQEALTENARASDDLRVPRP